MVERIIASLSRWMLTTSRRRVRTQAGRTSWGIVWETGWGGAGEEAMERAGEPAGELAGEQAGEPAGEPAGETAGESVGEAAGERAGEPDGEQAGKLSLEQAGVPAFVACKKMQDPGRDCPQDGSRWRACDLKNVAAAC